MSQSQNYSVTYENAIEIDFSKLRELKISADKKESYIEEASDSIDNGKISTENSINIETINEVSEESLSVSVLNGVSVIDRDLSIYESRVLTSTDPNSSSDEEEDEDEETTEEAGTGAGNQRGDNDDPETEVENSDDVSDDEFDENNQSAYEQLGETEFTRANDSGGEEDGNHSDGEFGEFESYSQYHSMQDDDDINDEGGGENNNNNKMNNSVSEQDISLVEDKTQDVLASYNPRTPARAIPPLDEEKINTIKKAMAGLNLKPSAGAGTLQNDVENIFVTQIHSSDSVISFWKTICRNDFDLSQGRINHPDQIGWQLFGMTHIYIREFYITMAETIIEKVSLIVKTRADGKSCSNCNALVLGTSGTGKSCFIFFLCVFLLKLDREKYGLPAILTFRYKRFDGFDFLLISNGEIQIYNGEIVDFYLSDDTDVFMQNSSKFLTLLVSDRSTNWKFFEKVVSTHPNNLWMYMPVWSIDELEQIAPNYYTESEIKLRYYVFGGSARNFLSSFSYVGKPDRSYQFIMEIMGWLLNDLIVALPENSVRCIVEHIKIQFAKHSRGIAEATNMFSSLMWHTSNGREFFWASRFMELVGAHILQQKEHSLCVSLTQFIGPSDRGCCFEYFGHRTLLKSNATICLKRLWHRSGSTGLELSDVTVMQKFDSIERIGSLLDSTYGIPIVRNFPLIGAVIQPHTLLQYTIGSKHTGSCVDTFEQIRQQLRDKDRNNHRLVFIVPAALRENFKWQEGHSDIKQFVCTYETVSSATQQEEDVDNEDNESHSKPNSSSGGSDSSSQKTKKRSSSSGSNSNKNNPKRKHGRQK